MLLPEAITELSMYRQFADVAQVPILATSLERFWRHAAVYDRRVAQRTRDGARPLLRRRFAP